jgi:hypothetical protein
VHRLVIISGINFAFFCDFLQHPCLCTFVHVCTVGKHKLLNNTLAYVHVRTVGKYKLLNNTLVYVHVCTVGKHKLLNNTLVYLHVQMYINKGVV